MRQLDIKKLKRLHGRHGRGKLGLVLCEGVRGCLEALRQCSGLLEFMVFREDIAETPELLEITELAKLSGRPAYRVSASSFTELSATESPQGVLCVLRRPLFLDSSEPCSDPFILILDRLSDPGNFGTIARTAWAAGLTELWVTTGTTDPYSPKSIRAGMGGQFYLRIREFANLSEVSSILSQHGYAKLWRSTPAAGIDCYSPEFNLGKSGLIIGNEAHGVDVFGDFQLPIIDVSIPMPGRAESLNAAQSATLLVFEGVRRGIIP